MTPNGVPVRIDPKDYPDSKQFLHAYHHPDHIRPDHHWVDWFVAFEKLVVVAILATMAIIVVSVVWCVLGGDLQTVFTVMGFVLGLATGECSQESCNGKQGTDTQEAEIALAALYYQLTLPG